MGLDMYIDARKNIGTPNEERKEKVYWRKFWDLQDYIVKITDGKIDNGEIKDIYGWRDFNIEQKFTVSSVLINNQVVFS